MLTLDDREVLGLHQGNTPRRPSAVSQVLRAVIEQLERHPASWDLESETHERYRIWVAADRVRRERAYALAQRVYQDAGYLPEDGNRLLVYPYDAQPDTFTLLAEDAAGQPVGTLTLVFDSPAGLPCDAIYGPELQVLRAQGRRLVEVTRLAVEERGKNSKALLLWLMNLVFIFGVRVRRAEEAVLEVNPRHVNYYRRLLRFQPGGSQRPCPRVHGAPAVMLRLDLSVYDREIRRVGGRGAAANERTLYPYFYRPMEEYGVAAFLAAQHRPMTDEETQHFGLYMPEARG